MSKIFSTDIEMSGNDISGAGDVGTATVNATTSISEGGTLLSDKYQGKDATLTAIAGTAPVANQMIHFTGADVATTVATGSVGLSVLASTTTALARTAIDCPPTSHASTGTSYGVSSTANYGHAKAATATTNNPVMDGVVSVGSTPTIFAQSNHVHPVDTSRAASVHSHVSTDVTDFTTAVDARISAGAYLPLAGGTMTGDITGSNTKFRARNIANTLFTDFTQNGVVSLADGATQQAELNFFADGTGTKTWGHLIVNGTANMTWENNDTLLNKDLRLSSGVYMVNPTDSCSIGFSTVASPGQPAMEIYNTHGAVRIGQASATYAYYETDATKNYFDKALEVYSNVAINAASVTITPAVNMTTTNLYAYKACDKTLIIGGQITKSSNFAAGDTLFTLASGGWPPFTTYAAVATSATAVVTLTISTAGVVTLSTIHHGTVGASMTLSFQTIRG